MLDVVAHSGASVVQLEPTTGAPGSGAAPHPDNTITTATMSLPIPSP
jgi:hypothetical protein